MITLAKENLSVDSERKLRRWLSLPEANTLRRVASAQCKFLQAEALSKALTTKSGDANDLLAQDSMREAARYNDFVRILDQFVNQPKEEFFFTAKLAPDTNNITPPQDHDENPE